MVHDRESVEFDTHHGCDRHRSGACGADNAASTPYPQPDETQQDARACVVVEAAVVDIEVAQRGDGRNASPGRRQVGQAVEQVVAPRPLRKHCLLVEHSTDRAYQAVLAGKRDLQQFDTRCLFGLDLPRGGEYHELEAARVAVHLTQQVADITATAALAERDGIDENAGGRHPTSIDWPTDSRCTEPDAISRGPPGGTTARTDRLDQRIRPERTVMPGVTAGAGMRDAEKPASRRTNSA